MASTNGTTANVPEASHAAGTQPAQNTADQAGPHVVSPEGACKGCGRPVGQRIQTVSQVPFPDREKLGNPGPLGLLSFAITTFVLGLYQCGAGCVHFSLSLSFFAASLHPQVFVFLQLRHSP